jgi:NAD-dependent protein deacetylase/lipoamidase
MSGQPALDVARRLLAGAQRAVAFTGAGVSTASGIPDFRSPGGVWSRYRPVPIQEFLASEEARRRYWRYKQESYAALAGARPNAAHAALARLEAEGRLRGVITQNVDGLHQAAGSRRVIELHGTNRRVECLECHVSFPADEIQARLEAGCRVPLCDACGGLLKPATVSFGQALRDDVLKDALTLARAADVLLVLGSSLQVYPAAGIPEAAAEEGADLLVVNRDPTPLDARAAVVLHGEVEDLLPSLVG